MQKASARDILIVKVTLFWTLLALASLFMERTLFAVIYRHDSQESLGSVLTTLISGIRFDLSLLPLFIAPLLLFIPIFLFIEKGAGNSSSAVHKALRLLQFSEWLILGTLNMICAASTINYSVNNKHFGWEFWAYLNDAVPIVGGVVIDHPILSVLAVIGILLYVYAGYVLFIKKSFLLSFDGQPKSTPLNLLQRTLLSCGAMISVIALMIILIRGGVQKNPLRAGDAMKGTESYINNLSLTGLFMVIHDAQDTIDFQVYYPEEENTAFAQQLIDHPDQFVSDKYPLVRYMSERSLIAGEFKSKEGQLKTKPHIVLILLESFTSKYLSHHGGDPRITPNLNRMINEGVYFERFMASGGRSANGFFSIYAGLPDRAGRTILRSGQIQNRFGGIGTLLSKKGYRSLFVHGGSLHFDHLNSALPRLGIDRQIGDTEIEKMNRYKKSNVWGYDDEVSFQILADEMDQMQTQPFFVSLFTLSTHHPYIVPDDRYRIFPSSMPQGDFLNSCYYTDAVIGEFMSKMKERPYFNRTVFIFTSDHASHAGLNYLEDRVVPLLIYAPHLFKHEIRRDLASQLDILPTILSLGGGDGYYAATGRDLTRNFFREPYAFYAGGSNTDMIGWAESDRMIFLWLHADEPLFASSVFPASNANLYDEEKKKALHYKESAKHFYQFARTLEKENRIWPTEQEFLTKEFLGVKHESP